MNRKYDDVSIGSAMVFAIIAIFISTLTAAAFNYPYQEYASDQRAEYVREWSEQRYGKNLDDFSDKEINLVFRQDAKYNGLLKSQSDIQEMYSIETGKTQYVRVSEEGIMLVDMSKGDGSTVEAPVVVK